MTEKSQQTSLPKNPPELNKKVEEEEKLKAKQKPKMDVEAKANSDKKPWLAVLFGLLLVAAIGVLGFFFMEQEKALDVLFMQQNQFVQQAESNVGAFQAVQDSLQALALENAEANKLVAEQQLELERLSRELISARLKINTSGGSSQDWLLEEAESLLRIAQQRLIISRDVRSALALFVSCDDILKQINDPAIFTIRNIIAADMAALRSVVEIDVQGIYLQLGVLAQNVGAMKVVSGSAEQLANAEKIPLGKAGDESQGGFFASILEKLGEYVVVRRTDNPIQPLLTPEQEFYIRQNIQLQLEQARVALLREQAQIYRNSISNALENIQLYLVEDGRKKQSLIEALTLLQESEIVVQIPLVSNSLTALQQILPEASQ